MLCAVDKHQQGCAEVILDLRAANVGLVQNVSFLGPSARSGYQDIINDIYFASVALGAASLRRKISIHYTSESSRIRLLNRTTQQDSVWSFHFMT